MDKDEKKNYNRTHYLKNREKLLEKAKARTKETFQPSVNVLPLFKGPVVKAFKNSSRENIIAALKWETIFLVILVGAMTYFLVTETASFYASIDGKWGNAFLKALILEGAVIAFTLMKAERAALNFAYKLMIGLVYAYSIWVISGSVIHSALQNQRLFLSHQKSVRELEGEVSKLETLRDHYAKTERVGLVRRYDHSLDSLRQNLVESRRTFVQVPDELMNWNSLFTLVVFRVLVMLSNLLCIRELGRRYCLRFMD
jgi:hypothetical protein